MKLIYLAGSINKDSAAQFRVVELRPGVYEVQETRTYGLKGIEKLEAFLEERRFNSIPPMNSLAPHL